MGISTVKGNGGFLGVDARRFITSSGIISQRKARIERLDNKLTPVYPSFDIINENFSSGDFTGWTVVNDGATKKWIISSGTPVKNGARNTVTVPSGSTYVAFASNDNTNNTYNDYTNVHFYKDFIIPAGSTGLTLTLDWMCKGEQASSATGYDFGYVGLAQTSFTPDPEELDLTEGSTYQRITNTNISNFNANNGKFNCRSNTTPTRCPQGLSPYDASEGFVSDSLTIDGSTITNGSIWQTGATRRLIFSFTSDVNNDYPPSWTITNIKLSNN